MATVPFGLGKFALCVAATPIPRMKYPNCIPLWNLVKRARVAWHSGTVAEDALIRNSVGSQRPRDAFGRMLGIESE